MSLPPLTDVEIRAIAVAVVASAACAVVGSMLVVRRQSLMSDAISHAVLPGLAVAFLATGSLGAGPMLAGAAAAGILTTFLTELLGRRAGVSSDAALGIVYTSLFALGVVLVKTFLRDVHFDVACVYEGSLLHASLDTVSLFGAETPRALLTAGAVLIVVVATTLLLWKELKLCAFDPALAGTMGFAPAAIHYLVMTLVAVTAAVGFEAVGAILVVAMMITPAATAQLLTDRLAKMTWLAALIATTGSVVGFGLARVADVSPAGSMATVAGVFYFAAALFAPRYGALAKAIAGLRLSLRVRGDDLLASLYRSEEKGHAPEAPNPGWALRTWLLRQGMIDAAGDRVRLTDSGRQAAARLVRSHRLWEAYLVQEVGLADDHVHEPAHRIEHYLDPEIDAQIEQTLGDASQDPHGRAIPDRGKAPRDD